MKGMWLLASMEVRERLRSTRWIASLSVWAGVLTIMLLGSFTLESQIGMPTNLGSVYTAITFFTLTVLLVIVPVFSAGSINGNRRDATLALVQSTPLTGGQIVFAKFFAAVGASTVFIGVALVFLTICGVVSGISFALQLLVALGLLFETFVIAGIGTGFSALVARPAGSMVLTLAVVMSLTVGGPLLFVFTFNSMREESRIMVQEAVYENDDKAFAKDLQPEIEKCQQKMRMVRIDHPERIWWLFTTSPYVLVPDLASIPWAVELAAQPQHTRDMPMEDSRNYVSALQEFSFAISAARGASNVQNNHVINDPRGEYISTLDSCFVKDGKPVEADYERLSDFRNQLNHERYDQQASLRFVGHSWYWSAALHGVLATAFLTVAVRRMRVPVRKLGSGIRIA